MSPQFQYNSLHNKQLRANISRGGIFFIFTENSALGNCIREITWASKG